MEMKYKVTLTLHTIILGLLKWWTPVQLQTLRVFHSSSPLAFALPQIQVRAALFLVPLPFSQADTTPPSHQQASWTAQPANHNSLLFKHPQALCCPLIQARNSPGLPDSKCL